MKLKTKIRKTLFINGVEDSKLDGITEQILDAVNFRKAIVKYTYKLFIGIALLAFLILLKIL